MAEFKLNIGDPKSKKTLKKDVKDAEAEGFLGKKIGDKVKGDSFGLTGYEFEVTGGSDYAGFPMRKDVIGTARKKILIVGGTGIRKNVDGRKVRRNIAGNTIHSRTAQINLKVAKQGKTPLFEEEKAEEAPAQEEKPAETKEEKPKAEEKPKQEEKKEEKPKEEAKPAGKKEEPAKEEKPKEAPKQEEKK